MKLRMSWRGTQTLSLRRTSPTAVSESLDSSGSSS
jgi:hypothetical protein